MTDINIRNPLNPNQCITDEAYEEMVDFLTGVGARGCTCFKSPPCSYCLHPGNPISRNENPDAWRDLTEDELGSIRGQEYLKKRRFSVD